MLDDALSYLMAIACDAFSLKSRSYICSLAPFALLVLSPILPLLPPPPYRHSRIVAMQEASSEPIRFELPSSTLVLLSEEVGALGSSATTVRGRVRDMASIAPRLEQFSPTWVFDIVLKDRCSKKEPIKYMFTLKSEDEKEIPMLPANGRRLHANRILRVKKITRFLAEKLSLDAAHEARLELTCNGKVLLPHVNLGSIKNCIWKSSGELVIAYRYRKD